MYELAQHCYVRKERTFDLCTGQKKWCFYEKQNLGVELGTDVLIPLSKVGIFNNGDQTMK